MGSRKPIINTILHARCSSPQLVRAFFAFGSSDAALQLQLNVDRLRKGFTRGSCFGYRNITDTFLQGLGLQGGCTQD